MINAPINPIWGRKNSIKLRRNFEDEKNSDSENHIKIEHELGWDFQNQRDHMQQKLVCTGIEVEMGQKNLIIHSASPGGSHPTLKGGEEQSFQNHMLRPMERTWKMGGWGQRSSIETVSNTSSISSSNLYSKAIRRGPEGTQPPFKNEEGQSEHNWHPREKIINCGYCLHISYIVGKE